MNVADPDEHPVGNPIGSVLSDAFQRVVDHTETIVAGLGPDDLAWQPDPDANSIGWLIWHLARVQDDHVAGLADHEQVLTDAGFADRLDFGLPVDDIGYGHSVEEAARVRPSGPEVLLDYLRAVTARTHEYVANLDADELGRVVDRRWDPPVTAGVRLISVLDDCVQHTGQAAYVRGLLDRAAR